jgi:predicted phage terminase large subunit-like protein
LRRLKVERARRSLRTFIEVAWPVVETEAFVSGWHVDAVAEHLEAVTRGDIRRLLITIPPRFGKSNLVSVFWPVWTWASRPEARWLYASYAESLAVRDAVKARRLIQSQWFQENWGSVFQLAGDANLKHRYENDHGGHRLAVGVAGSITGEGGDFIVCDDPHNVKEAESDAMRQGVLSWFDTVLSTRANDPQRAGWVIILQRCHQDDLAGHVLEQGGWEHLNLPMEYESDRRCETCIGWRDPRASEGELLWPARFGLGEVADAKRVLGSYAYSAQFQQRPSPAGGGIFQRHWWRYWRPAHLKLPPVMVRMPDGSLCAIAAIPLPDRFDQVLQSWDCAFKDKITSDYVVGQVWAALKADRFLLDQKRDRLNMPATKAAVTTMTEKWPAAATKLIEDAANGPAVIAELQHDIAGLIAVSPQGSKSARAQAASPQIESGNVYLPHPAIAPWVDALIEECAAFPNGRHDDQVDSMSQALNRLRKSRSLDPEFFKQCMQANRELTGYSAWRNGDDPCLDPECGGGQTESDDRTIIGLDGKRIRASDWLQ